VERAFAKILSDERTALNTLLLYRADFRLTKQQCGNL